PLSTSENTKSFLLTLLRINEINTAIHTTAATPIAPYLMNFFLRSLSRTSLGISLSITYCNFLLVIFVLKNKQHPCQESNLLIINNKQNVQGVRNRTPCTFLNISYRTIMTNANAIYHLL